MRILIVEDETLIALAMQHVLRNAGHAVVGIAATADGALGLIGPDRPDLALVDINLRGGRGTGIGLARHLRERCGVPSLFVSGQVVEARANRDAALGHLGKPHDPGTLLASVEIAGQVIRGERRAAPPPGLELFDGGGGLANLATAS